VEKKKKEKKKVGLVLFLKKLDNFDNKLEIFTKLLKSQN
jgi:hypothetical protein